MYDKYNKSPAYFLIFHIPDGLFHSVCINYNSYPYSNYYSYFWYSYYCHYYFDPSSSNSNQYSYYQIEIEFLIGYNVIVN